MSVSVPFGAAEAEIEATLVKFVNQLCYSKEMRKVRNLFIVPVGLPGMGKSTFSKNLKRATSKISQQNNNLKTNSKKEKEHSFGNVTFTKISYDRILGEKVTEYQKANKDCEMHTVIDIIRPFAD